MCVIWQCWELRENRYYCQPKIIFQETKNSLKKGEGGRKENMTFKLFEFEPYFQFICTFMESLLSWLLWIIRNTSLLSHTIVLAGPFGWDLVFSLPDCTFGIITDIVFQIFQRVCHLLIISLVDMISRNWFCSWSGLGKSPLQWGTLITSLI